MAWMDASRSSLNKTPKGRVLFALEWIFAGLLFGILVTFGWHRAVHAPLVFITVAAFGGMFISTLFIRREKRKNVDSDKENPLAIPPHLR